MDHSPAAVVQRIEGDVNELLEMYNFAEKTYEYSNLHGDRANTEQAQRTNN